AGKLQAGVGTSQVEQGECWRGWDDRSRIARLSERALESDPATVVEWNLPTATGETGGNPEAGRRGAQAWYPDGAGSVYPAGGDAGSATQMGPDVFRSQLRVSTQTLGASGDRSGTAVCDRRISLGGGPGFGEVLRSSVELPSEK